MPQDKTRNTISRQWELLRLLPGRGPGRTASELVGSLADAGFPVSKRTVERDLQDLSALFPLCCNDKARPYGWYWMTNRSLGLPALTLAEALSMNLLEGQLRPLLPASLLSVLDPKFREARNKLNGLSATNETARWKDKVRTVTPSLPLKPPVIDKDILEQVQEALLKDKQLNTTYLSMDTEEAKEITLHPLAMIQRGPVTYVVATAYDYADLRLYAMHRFRNAEILDKSIRPPEGFDIDDYIAKGAMEFGTGKQLTLKARINADLAHTLLECALSDDMQLKQDGERYRLTATLADSWQLRWWIMSQGDAIEVISPKRLRREIVEQLNRAVKNYNI